MDEFKQRLIEAGWSKKEAKNEMTTYGQDIILDGGDSCGTTGCETPEEATRLAVEMAYHDGWRPRRWYELWKPHCPDHVREEYKRQSIDSPPQPPASSPDG